MEIVHPDNIEYNFILKGLCTGASISKIEFRCESYQECDENMEGDIMFLPAPMAVRKLDNYSMLNSGNIFSYFNGPSIMLTVKDFDNVYVKKGDLLSFYYGKVLTSRYKIIIGNGEPVLTEPGRIMELYNKNIEKIDLYEEWGRMTNFLPMPLYIGLINNNFLEIKTQVEKLIYSSIKNSLENFNSVAEEIYRERKASNPDLVKMIILQYVNKRSIDMGKEELEAIDFLRNLMKNSA
jgi:predicted solute-binding protein